MQEALSKVRVYKKTILKIASLEDRFEIVANMSSPKRLINFSTPYILNGEFFEIISQNGESVTVRCCHCAGRNIYKGSVKSTGNFHMHIKRKHPSLIPKVNESKLNAYRSRKSQQKRQLNVNRKSVKKEKMSGNIGVNFSSEIQKVNLNTRLNPYAEAKFEAAEYLESESQSCDDFIMDLSSETSEHPAIKRESNQTQISESQIQLASHHHKLPTTHSPSPSTQLNRNPVAAAIGTNEFFRALPRIEGILRNIEREMQLRNQIESNRLFLELAKFKYINPDFAFRF